MGTTASVHLDRMEHIANTVIQRCDRQVKLDSINSLQNNEDKHQEGAQSLRHCNCQVFICKQIQIWMNVKAVHAPMAEHVWIT